MNFFLLLPTVAGLCGSLFLSYCVYFDGKRRSDPDFKKKLHERRNPKPAEKRKAILRFPKLDDALACQNFFLIELGKASKCFDEEKIDEAIDHMANSLCVCDDGKRNSLLVIFEKKYPPAFVYAIMQRIPEAEKRLRDYHSSTHAEEEEREDTTHFPCTTDKNAIQKFVGEEIALANECAEDGNFGDASYHYANVVVILDDDERQEILTQLRRALGDDFFALIIQATGPAQRRLREKLLQEDQALAIQFLFSLPLILILASGIVRSGKPYV